MDLSDITVLGAVRIISLITGILTLVGIVFVAFRGIVTKKDCKDCKADVDSDFESGSKEFKQLRQVQTDHGEQLAGIGATVNGMASNVDKLVNRHMGGSE